MKIHFNVGDEVYLKCTVTRIKKKGDDDYYIDVEYPDWFYIDRGGKMASANVIASQHLIFGKEDET